MEVHCGHSIPSAAGQNSKTSGWIEVMTETWRGHSSISKSWGLAETSRNHHWASTTNQRALSRVTSTADFSRTGRDQAVWKVASIARAHERILRRTNCPLSSHHHITWSIFYSHKSLKYLFWLFGEKQIHRRDIFKNNKWMSHSERSLWNTFDGVAGFRMWRARNRRWHPGVRGWRRPEELPFQRGWVGGNQ